MNPKSKFQSWNSGDSSDLLPTPELDITNLRFADLCWMPRIDFTRSIWLIYMFIDMYRESRVSKEPLGVGVRRCWVPRVPERCALLSTPSFHLLTPTVKASRHDHCFNQYPVHRTLHWPKWTNIHKRNLFHRILQHKFPETFFLLWSLKQRDRYHRDLQETDTSYTKVCSIIK